MFRLLLTCCLFATSSGITVDIQSSASSGRIVGGSTAFNGQFPFQVSLRSGARRTHYCGAFIITENWIGSAAHCTSGKTPRGVVAVVGTLARLHEGTTYKLSRFENHPDFNSSNLVNDISLIKTETRIFFSPVIQPIRFGSGYVKGGINAIALGWGYTSHPGEASANLQWTKVITIGNDECRSKMTRTNSVKVVDSSICAVALETGGACMGDSGGPLIADYDGTLVLIGIISWGVPCSVGYPDVYTRVTSFHSWIDRLFDF